MDNLVNEYIINEIFTVQLHGVECMMDGNTMKINEIGNAVIVNNTTMEIHSMVKTDLSLGV